MATLDFSQVEEREGFNTLPTGAYTVALAKVEQKMSNSSGKPMYSVEFVIQGPIYAQRRLWDNFSLQLNSMWKLQAFLQALHPEEEIGKTYDWVENGDQGRQVVALVKHEVYNGKLSERIEAYWPANEKGQEVLARNVPDPKSVPSMPENGAQAPVGASSLFSM